MENLVSDILPVTHLHERRTHPTPQPFQYHPLSPDRRTFKPRAEPTESKNPEPESTGPRTSGTEPRSLGVKTLASQDSGILNSRVRLTESPFSPP